MVNRDYQVIMIPEPYTTPGEKLASIAEQLGIKADKELMPRKLEKLLRKHAAESDSATRLPVLMIIDEMQAMSHNNTDILLRVLEILKELYSDLRILIVAQPVFHHAIKAPKFTALREAAISMQLDTVMDDDQTTDYINRRIRRSGHNSSKLFTPEAIRLIAYASRGNPLMVNRISHQALINTQNDRLVRVGPAQATRAIRDTEGAGYPFLLKPLIMSSGSLQFNIMLLIAFAVNMALLFLLI
jgi:MSHA biogenesis protein MshM